MEQTGRGNLGLGPVNFKNFIKSSTGDTLKRGVKRRDSCQAMTYISGNQWRGGT